MVRNDVIPEEILRWAKERIGEDEETKERALLQMRKWIAENDRIKKFNGSDVFLLAFLRKAKFNVTQALTAFESYLLCKSSCPAMLCNLSYISSISDHIFTNGCIVTTPQRDKEGRRWIIFRPGLVDLDSTTNFDCFKVVTMTVVVLISCEEDQITGTSVIYDMKDLPMSVLTLMPPNELIRVLKFAQNSSMVRLKNINIINFSPVAKYVIDIIRSVMTEKSNVKIFSTTEEFVNSCLDTSALPKEYGGQRPIADMIRDYKQEIEDKRDKLMEWDSMQVDPEMFSEDEKAASDLRLELRYLNQGRDVGLLCGTFRKLEVD